MTDGVPDSNILIDHDIVPVSEVFRLQGLAAMLETQAEFEARGRDIASAAAGVAS